AGSFRGSLWRSLLGRAVGALLAFAVCSSQIAGAEILPFASGEQPDPVLVGAKAVGLTAGDCTGDDLPDLIVAAQNSNNVDVLRNLGDGRLEAGGGSVLVSQAMGAACADFNGDGLVDIAAVGRNGDISFFFRDATDTLTLAGTRQAG